MNNAARGASAVLIALLGSSTSGLATPADEINRTVSANDVSNIEQASGRQFNATFSVVLARIGAKEVPSDVSSAIKHHPDFALSTQPPCIDAANITSTILGSINPRNIPSVSRISSPELPPGS